MAGACWQLILSLPLVQSPGLHSPYVIDSITPLQSLTYSASLLRRAVCSYGRLPRPRNPPTSKPPHGLKKKKAVDVEDDPPAPGDQSRDPNQPHLQSFQSAAPVAYANLYPTLSKQDSDSLFYLYVPISIKGWVRSATNAASELAVVHPLVGTPAGGFRRKDLSPPHHSICTTDTPTFVLSTLLFFDPHLQPI